MFGNVMPSALRESWFCVCACVDLVVHVFYLYVFIGMSGEALCSSRLHVLLCVFVCVCAVRSFSRSKQDTTESPVKPGVSQRGGKHAQTNLHTDTDAQTPKCIYTLSFTEFSSICS